jgi:hypothetical protein
MVKNQELIGAIAIYWQEPRSFTEKQMELVSNFAAQATSRSTNAQLLSELRESLQQQTATPMCSRSSAAGGAVEKTKPSEPRIAPSSSPYLLSQKTASSRLYLALHATIMVDSSWS